MAVVAGIHAATRSRARSLAPCEWTWPLLRPRSLDSEPDPSADDHPRHREALKRRQLTTERLELKDSPPYRTEEASRTLPPQSSGPQQQVVDSGSVTGTGLKPGAITDIKKGRSRAKCLRSGARGKVRRGKCPSTTQKWDCWGGWIRTTDYLTQRQALFRSAASRKTRSAQGMSIASASSRGTNLPSCTFGSTGARVTGPAHAVKTTW